MDPLALKAVFNHLVLPPQLPGAEDTDYVTIDRHILSLVSSAIQDLDKDGIEGLSQASQMLSRLAKFHDVQVYKQHMVKALETMVAEGGCLLLHIREQNAGILCRTEKSLLIVEAFEVSLKSEAVLQAPNVLVCEYPDTAASISLEDPIFRECLSEFLEKASTESLSQFAAKTHKSKNTVTERRDTADPGLVTEVLMQVLESRGQAVEVPKLVKRVRDDVNWLDSEIPWRRSPLWLVLRIGLHRMLSLSSGVNATVGRLIYKLVICMTLVKLLQAGQGVLHPTIMDMIVKKLSRRLAKLEATQEHCQGELRTICDRYLNKTRGTFEAAIGTALDSAQKAFDAFKRSTMRVVPRLRPSVNASDLQIPLQNSRPFLQSLLNGKPAVGQAGNDAKGNFVIPSDLDEETTPFLAKRLHKLSGIEATSYARVNNKCASALDAEVYAFDMSRSINQYLDEVGTLYNGIPEQTSTCILTTLELWVAMDQSATAACELLSQYHPVFTPEPLDFLQLPTGLQMRRLQAIQTYLKKRVDQSSSEKKSIFSGPDDGCFAHQYVMQEAGSQNKKGSSWEIWQRVNSASVRARDYKNTEYANLQATYDDLSDRITSLTCSCTFDYMGKRNVHGCRRCWHWRQRKKLKIDIHEDYLPGEMQKANWEAAAIIFELRIPTFIAAYRDVTWRILRTLASPEPPKEAPIPLQLSELKSLVPYKGTPGDSIVTLGSSKKSWLQTHFNHSKFPRPLQEVLLPFAPQFEYYATDISCFTSAVTGHTPTYIHQCGLRISKELGIPKRVLDGELWSTHSESPTSYEIVASQSSCPPHMSIHEYMANQRLIPGTETRWLTVLSELASSNLNIGSDGTASLLTQLAIQAGPSSADLSRSRTRKMYRVFNNPLYAQRLLEQLERRLVAIESSWREGKYMDVITTLLIRFCDVATNSLPDEHARAVSLLLKARETTLSWVASLRKELQNATDLNQAYKISEYAWTAAVLCRRTFVMHDRGATKTMSDDAIRHWLEASISMQENFVISVPKMTQFQRKLYLRDVKMAFGLRDQLTTLHPRELEAAIRSTWPDPQGTRHHGPWSHIKNHAGWNKFWLENKVPIQGTNGYRVLHLNVIDGRFHIDGKPLGHLPEHIRNTDVLNRLFQTSHLRVFPSELSGMMWSLHGSATPEMAIHIGIRNSKPFVRTCSIQGRYEYIPTEVFDGAHGRDLPYSLINASAHWLNLVAARIEIRREPVIWRTRPGDWIVDLRKNMASRRTGILLNPQCSLAKDIARIFEGFIAPNHLTIFQSQKENSQKRNINIEIRHLELSFHITPYGNLFCNELRAEVDHDQDAGTLYGLRSVIVLRESRSANVRSLITPLGEFRSQAQGMHISVNVENEGRYGHYRIDPVLGRLVCAPEPLLLFCKAQFHACTSSVIPDRLTGRTGCEEAILTLQSAICQPWTPLTQAQYKCLRRIEALSPTRAFYPADMKVMEKVQWNTLLPPLAQHDAYRPLVNAIVERSNKLQLFHGTQENCELTEEVTDLRTRGELKRLRFERPGGATRGLVLQDHPDTPYISRYWRARNDQPRHSVAKTMHLLTQPDFRLSSTKQMVAQLQKIPQPPPPAQVQLHNGLPLMPPLTTLLDAGTHIPFWHYVKCCQQWPEVGAAFLLAVLSVRGDVDDVLMSCLAAFCRVPALRQLPMPKFDGIVNFKYFNEPKVETFLPLLVGDMKQNFESSVELTQEQRMSKRAVAQAFKNFEQDRESDARKVIKLLINQWPCALQDLRGHGSQYIDADNVLQKVMTTWDVLYQSHILSKFVKEIRDILLSFVGTVPLAFALDLQDQADRLCPEWNERTASSLSLKMLILKSAPTLKGGAGAGTWTGTTTTATGGPPRQPRHMNRNMHSATSVELGGLLLPFAKSKNRLRAEYAQDLLASLKALQTGVSAVATPSIPHASMVERAINDLKKALELQNSDINDSLARGTPGATWLQRGRLWPVSSRVSLLELLGSASGCDKFGPGMRESLVTMGVTMTALQRQTRILGALLNSLNPRNKGRGEEELREELRNGGHVNWDPQQNTDWLLLEIESNLLIRPDQIEVANATVNPDSGENSVLQMNMGRGKTSCIIPMAVACLANGNQLCRIVVPKALLTQTAQILQAKLGGILGRQVSHVPFSRSTDTSPEMLQAYINIHQHALSSRGLILTQPEHLLSFKLSGIQRLADKKTEAGRTMIEFQNWLYNTCRDVIDESDLALAVKQQLIYPSGREVIVDGHPHRWLCVQAMLDLTEDHARALQHEYPLGIQFVPRPDGYPIMFFLRPELEDILMARVVDHIVTGRSPILRLASGAKTIDSKFLRHFIYDDDTSIDACRKACKPLVNPRTALNQLLLIRGLVKNKILLLCLKKRWNVQYGLHPKRKPIAVPFEAKGVPHPQAEYGHPDVAIILTCLAFYYTGLSVTQLRSSLQRILGADDPASEYEQWISGCSGLREELRHWNLINIDDARQVEELWRKLRFSKTVLDHYMNVFVFPAHAKQFDIKLQASGWDIPLFSAPDKTAGLKRAALTTGFSGTNDNRRMLPLTIQQRDLQSLQQTNAEVLTYLLESRNRWYCAAANRFARWTETDLLQFLESRKIRILIDAGAMVLEMTNKKLIEAWQGFDNKARAAVFFNENNQAMVRYRGGKEAPLATTPFAENLDECLVYLDEAHTRGTDLKLPRDAVGAVTLGLGQTKDHTVQAAMRMRQLGSTQSIVFVAPPEVDQGIRMVCGIEDKQMPDSSHVVQWLLEQTCRGNEQLIQLHHAQGLDFCRRTSALLKRPGLLAQPAKEQAYVSELLTPEHQTLKELYCPARATTNSGAASGSGSRHDFSCGALKDFAHDLDDKRRAAENVSGQQPIGALEEVEQEREVEFQVEEVRQPQRPPRYEPLLFPGLDNDIARFAREGVLPAQGAGFRHAFDAVAATAVGKKFGVVVPEDAARVFVSREFMLTVKARTDCNDGFMRPVEWMLFHIASATALVVIAEEAELLLRHYREIRDSGKTTATHIVAYTPAVTKAMAALNPVSYFAIPPLPKAYVAPRNLVADLGIFAGRLYFPFSEYGFLSAYLRGRGGGSGSGEGGLTAYPPTAKFAPNPADFVVEWLAASRKGQDVMQTPIGYVCQGRPLGADHAFFAVAAAKEVPSARRGGIWGEDRDVNDESGDGNETEDSGSDDEWDVEADKGNEGEYNESEYVLGSKADDSNDGNGGRTLARMSSMIGKIVGEVTHMVIGEPANGTATSASKDGATDGVVGGQ